MNPQYLPQQPMGPPTQQNKPPSSVTPQGMFQNVPLGQSKQPYNNQMQNGPENANDLVNAQANMMRSPLSQLPPSQLPPVNRGQGI